MRASLRITPFIDAHERHDAGIAIEPRVDDQRLQRRIDAALRRRNALDDALEQLVDAEARLGADAHGILGRDADDVLDLADDALGIGRRQIDLVDDGQHLEALLDGRVAVRDALRFDALARVDDEQRAVAGGERARNLVGEVDVPRRVDEVDLVVEPVARPVLQRDALRLDRDAALALEIHRVEHLILHLARREAAAQLNEPIGQRGLAVIDVRDDREVADPFHGAWAGRPSRRRGL